MGKALGAHFCIAEVSDEVTMQRLVRRGWLRKTMAWDGGVSPYVRRPAYELTEAGRAIARENLVTIK